MIKYLGSKRRLVPQILDLVDALPDVRTVSDLFSGTARVAHALKARGYQVAANDHNTYAATLAHCYVAADADQVRRPAEQLVAEFNQLPGQPGWFTALYCEQSRFFHPRNGARIEAIREALAAKGLPPDLEAVMLVALMEAADRVDSTTGLQMAYLKDWAPRALGELTLRVPQVLPGAGRATQLDAVEAAAALPADLVYLDPPYNQHSYRGNYHVWETLVRWDQPEVYGVACKRVDCRAYRSPFNSRPGIGPALEAVIAACQARYVLVSFNNEGYLPRDAIEGILAARGPVATLAVDFQRYVGAQIGIYNPQGDKVGRVSHLRNKELLYLVPDLGPALPPRWRRTVAE